MDIEKLRAYLDSRKEAEKGGLVSLGPGEDSVSSTPPSMNDLSSMPDDIKKLVIDSQLKRAGSSFPAINPRSDSDENREERMAKELAEPKKESWEDQRTPKEQDVGAAWAYGNGLYGETPLPGGNATQFYNPKNMPYFEPDRFKRLKDMLKSRK